MIPIANKAKAKSPAKGFKARAASAAVPMFVIPFENKAAAEVAMIKNIIRLEKTSRTKHLFSSYEYLPWY